MLASSMIYVDIYVCVCCIYLYVDIAKAIKFSQLLDAPYQYASRMQDQYQYVLNALQRQQEEENRVAVSA